MNPHNHQKLSAFLENRKALLLRGFLLVFVFLALVAKISLAENGAAGSAVASSDQTNAQDAAKNQQLIKQKLEEIRAMQAEINKYQGDIKNKQKEGRTLKNEIAIYDSKIIKNQLEIRETKARIEEAELEIAQAKNKIEEDGENIEKSKQSLRQFIQVLYGYQQDSMIEILVAKNNISEFFNEVNSIEAAKDKIFQSLMDLKKEKEDLARKSLELEASQVDYQGLIEMKSAQNESLGNLKFQKDEILKITNGEEEKFQALVVQKQSLLPSLRAELRDLQSLGNAINFNDAISAARYVGGITGVRPALLLGILRVESGLGTNVGGGTYAVDMHPKERPTFENITKELGYDPNAMPVSKKPVSYQGWGGAMGPAQMMPTTWLSHRAEVAQLVKKDLPDPWSLTDSIAAIAVKLSKVDGVTSGNYDSEYKAAGIYLAGNNWQRFPFYPNKVMYYADLYEKELNS